MRGAHDETDVSRVGQRQVDLVFGIVAGVALRPAPVGEGPRRAADDAVDGGVAGGRTLGERLLGRGVLDGEALGKLFDRCEAAMGSAAALSELPVPDAVLAFFRRMGDQRIMPLSDVAAEVFVWLDDHDATRLFVVSRPE